MKSDTYAMRIARLFSPIFVYLGITLVCSFVYMSFCSAELMAVVNASSESAFNAAVEAYQNKINKDGLLLTGVVNLLTIPFLIRMMRKDARRLAPLEVDSKPMHYALLAIVGIFSSVGLNFLLMATGVSEMLDDTYEETYQIIFESPLWMQYVISALIGPILEELLFRGIIFKRLRTYAIFPLAALVSAIAFGGFHMNLLQFIYATILGLVLALVYEKFHSIIACIIVHACGNASSVMLTSDAGVYNLLGGNDDRILITTIVTCVIAVISFVALWKINNNGVAENNSEIYEEVSV